MTWGELKKRVEELGVGNGNVEVVLGRGIVLKDIGILEMYTPPRTLKQPPKLILFFNTEEKS